MSEIEIENQYGSVQPDTARANHAERARDYEIGIKSNSFPEKASEYTPSKIVKVAVACMLFSTGFLTAMLIFDTPGGMATDKAYIDNHRENDQADFLREMNSWPKRHMAKYLGQYPETYNAFAKMWKAKDAGGESGLFREGRTIKNNMAEYINDVEHLGKEAFFKLFNIPVSTGGAFADIWLFNSNDMGESDRDALEHLTKKSQQQEFLNKNVMNFEYYKRNWFYNTIEKLWLKDYDKLLNGYARIIYFRVGGGGDDPMGDFKQNTIVSMYEGRILGGVPHGLGRMFTYDDQAVHIGYYKHGVPSGKMIHYSKDVREEGLWRTNNDGTHTVKPQKITSFLANTPYPQP